MREQWALDDRLVENLHDFWDVTGERVAIIPATPENEAALRRIANAFEALHSRLMALLAPEVIEQNLATLANTVNLLLAEQKPKQ
jgi:DNA-binding MarR family transcriptional regulator